MIELKRRKYFRAMQFWMVQFLAELHRALSIFIDKAKTPYVLSDSMHCMSSVAVCTYKVRPSYVLLYERRTRRVSVSTCRVELTR